MNGMNRLSQAMEEALPFVPPSRDQMKKILGKLRAELGVEGEPTWRKYLTFSLPGENKNRYHYFAAFQKGDKVVAANASGRIGKEPNKVTSLGEYPDTKAAVKGMETKLLKKMKKGYEPTEV